MNPIILTKFHKDWVKIVDFYTGLIDVAVERLCDSRIIEVIFIHSLKRPNININRLVSKSLHISNYFYMKIRSRLPKLRVVFNFKIFCNKKIPQFAHKYS